MNIYKYMASLRENRKALRDCAKYTVELDMKV